MNDTHANEVVPFSDDMYAMYVSAREMFSELTKSVRLTMRLAKGNLDMHQGMSFENMGFLETLMVRGVREFRLREFNSLFNEVKAYREDFRAKAEKADPLLRVFGETVPVSQTNLDEVHPDVVLSTHNQAWTDNMGQAYIALMDCVEDIGRMLSEYWEALDRISDKVNARRGRTGR